MSSLGEATPWTAIIVKLVLVRTWLACSTSTVMKHAVLLKSQLKEVLVEVTRVNLSLRTMEDIRSRA